MPRTKLTAIRKFGRKATGKYVKDTTKTKTFRTKQSLSTKAADANALENGTRRGKPRFRRKTKVVREMRKMARNNDPNAFGRTTHVLPHAGMRRIIRRALHGIEDVPLMYVKQEAVDTLQAAACDFGIKLLGRANASTRLVSDRIQIPPQTIMHAFFDMTAKTMDIESRFWNNLIPEIRYLTDGQRKQLVDALERLPSMLFPDALRAALVAPSHTKRRRVVGKKRGATKMSAAPTKKTKKGKGGLASKHVATTSPPHVSPTKRVEKTTPTMKKKMVTTPTKTENVNANVGSEQPKPAAIDVDFEEHDSDATAELHADPDDIM